MLHYQQLSFEERTKIFTGLMLKKSISSIAREVRRSPSTIIREVRRNSKNGIYSPEKAQTNYKIHRQKQETKVSRNIRLQQHIIDKLKNGWSPGTIAGRLKYEGTNITVCAETIYQFIYSKKMRDMGLYNSLVRKHPIRQLKLRGRKHRSIIPNRISIDQRPKYINQRIEIGHMETDLIFCRGNQSENILTSVDRKSRFVVLAKNTCKDSMLVADAFIRAIKREKIPIKSSTFDNGVEFAKHMWMRRFLNIETFFCDPYSPWQKGQIENTNGRLRRYIPKNANIRNFSEEHLRHIQNLMNDHPRRCLGYRTPREVLCEEKSKLNGGYCWA